jgi:hypothetical protein
MGFRCVWSDFDLIFVIRNALILRQSHEMTWQYVDWNTVDQCRPKESVVLETIIDSRRHYHSGVDGYCSLLEYNAMSTDLHKFWRIILISY